MKVKTSHHEETVRVLSWTLRYTKTSTLNSMPIKMLSGPQRIFRTSKIKSGQMFFMTTYLV
jgi:hypothetical protein